MALGTPQLPLVPVVGVVDENAGESLAHQGEVEQPPVQPDVDQGSVVGIDRVLAVRDANPFALELPLGEPTGFLPVAIRRRGVDLGGVDADEACLAPAPARRGRSVPQRLQIRGVAVGYVRHSSFHTFTGASARAAGETARANQG